MVSARSMTPACALAPVLAWPVTCALTVVSVETGCHTKWNWSSTGHSEYDVIAAWPNPVPAPSTVQVPADSDWFPTRAGLPMSWQLQPDGHGEAGAGGAGVTVGGPMLRADTEARCRGAVGARAHGQAGQAHRRHSNRGVGAGHQRVGGAVLRGGSLESVTTRWTIK